MDSSESQYLFKETRVNLEPPIAHDVVAINVHPGSSRRATSEPSFEDETTFRTKNLAIAASIFHRKHHDAPRSFLWRVLKDGLVLSVRVVDVCKREKTSDAPLDLHFHFEQPILPQCVVLVDPVEHDALCIHVLDETQHLYSFTLRPDFFKKRSAVDSALADLAKVQAPSGFTFKYPHRMVAVDANRLLVAVSDGGMIRLDKEIAGDAQRKNPWKETFFNPQGWAQNLRSLLPFQGKHTIKYGKQNLEYSAATAVQTTDLGLGGSLFGITICLDHRMRIWNLDDGQIIYIGDILNAERSPQEIGKWSIDPSQSNLIQVVSKHRGQSICATFSPIGAGEFKFWKIIAKGSHAVTVEDMFPNKALVPATPSSDVWTMADFALSTSTDSSELALWTLWKNNMTYRVRRLGFDKNTLRQSWDESWDGVYAETGILTAESSGPGDSTDVTERWLQLILQPGKFTKATLKTALSIYERGLGVPPESNKGRGLAEAICTVLGSTASLERGSSGAMDYDQFRASSETQWRRFYRLLVELDRQRGEALGLALDPEADTVWVVCTDLLSIVRECSTVERLYHNPTIVEEGRNGQAALISTASAFVEGFSDSYLQSCNAALRPELFEQSSQTELERIEHFSDKSAFYRGLSDEDCAPIFETLGRNFSVVTDELYNDVLELVCVPVSARKKPFKYPLTEFGKKLFMKSIQETVELHWKICFSQLVLLVFMEFEYDDEQDALHHRVDIGHVFRRLVLVLRKLELLKWLARTELSLTSTNTERDASPGPSKRTTEEATVTALESTISHLLGFDELRHEPLSVTLTELVGSFCSPESDVEISTSIVQCSLLKSKRPDLAAAFTPFCDQEPFSVYVQGRVSLAMNNFASAATEFRRAAIGMSAENAQHGRHSSGLLDDVEWKLLHNGLARYYSHVVALFEKQRAYSYVVEFSRLAIQFSNAKHDAYFSTTDILSRFFNAAVATSQFDLAHTTLLSFKDEALRHSSLRKLVSQMCEGNHTTELASLPFPSMQQEVEQILADRCRNATDVEEGFPYHHVLYSWRIRHNNYRGAAAVLFDRIQKLKNTGQSDNITGDDTLDTPVTKQYLLLINVLSCIDPRQAWIYDEGQGEATYKRKVVSLPEVRKQYQDELDRIAAIQNNQFGFQADDVMELA